MTRASRRWFLQDVASCAAGLLLHRAACAARFPAAWHKSPHNPILSLGPAGAFDSHNIMSPAVARHDGRYFLFYSGGPAGPKSNEDYVHYQLGLALSDDGDHFRKTGTPLLELGQRDNFHCCPALLRNPGGDLRIEDGQWHLLYNGNRADDVEHDTSPDGLTWTKDRRSPIYRFAYSPSLVRTADEYRMYYVHKPPHRSGRAIPWEIHLATGSDLYSLHPHAANPVLTLSQPWEKANLFYPYVLKEGRRGCCSTRRTGRAIRAASRRPRSAWPRAATASRGRSRRTTRSSRRHRTATSTPSTRRPSR